jgi:tetratricopeptide repeat protein 21B
MDSTMSIAHILLAQIFLQKGNYKNADQSLEMGLSHHFEVREHPTYHLIKAIIQKNSGQYDEAIKTLQTAMQLPGVKKTGK